MSFLTFFIVKLLDVVKMEVKRCKWKKLRCSDLVQVQMERDDVSVEVVKFSHEIIVDIDPTGSRGKQVSFSVCFMLIFIITCMCMYMYIYVSVCA